ELCTVLVLVHAHGTEGSYATVQTTESTSWGTPASGRPPHCRAAHPGAHGAKNPAPCRPLRAALHRTGVGVGSPAWQCPQPAWPAAVPGRMADAHGGDHPCTIARRPPAAAPPGEPEAGPWSLIDRPGVVRRHDVAAGPHAAGPARGKNHLPLLPEVWGPPDKPMPGAAGFTGRHRRSP